MILAKTRSRSGIAAVALEDGQLVVRVEFNILSRYQDGEDVLSMPIEEIECREYINGDVNIYVTRPYTYEHIYCFAITVGQETIELTVNLALYLAIV